jgi:hypothetical protein
VLAYCESPEKPYGRFPVVSRRVVSRPAVSPGILDVSLVALSIGAGAGAMLGVVPAAPAALSAAAAAAALSAASFPPPHAPTSSAPQMRSVARFMVPRSLE